MNEVDKLKAKICKLQKSCSHHFMLPDNMPLILRHSESQVTGVLIGGYFGSIEPYWKKFEITCNRCSVAKEVSTGNVCPNCLTEKKDDLIYYGAGSFEEYFGFEPVGYFSAVISKCENCGLALVSAYWDQ